MKKTITLNGIEYEFHPSIPYGPLTSVEKGLKEGDVRVIGKAVCYVTHISPRRPYTVTWDILYLIPNFDYKTKRKMVEDFEKRNY
jgi:hypothetical protein